MNNKALRLAGYLLIAHFVVVAAFSFAGQGSPNYTRLAVMLALLFGAASALFAPRKRGWLIVLAYLILVLGYQLVSLWANWSNSAVPPGTKVVMLAVWAVINSLPIVALVLVFKPANFAAFKSSLPETATSEGLGPKS
jgi:peptidoglycan/LPS O-acetylase OafA/YrhL